MAQKPTGGGWNMDQMSKTGLTEALEPVLALLAPLKGNMRPLFIALAVAATLILGKQMFFQLEPEEQAIVLRLGKPRPQVFESGLHTRIPFVDQVYKVPVHTQHRMEFGFRSNDNASGRSSNLGTQAYQVESLMLTGDLMLVHVRWSLVYKIEDIHTWLFEIKDRQDTIRDISMGVMRQIVGDYSLDEVLTTKQLEIANLAQDTTQSALRDKVPTGVVITEVAIKSADVPEAARKAFDDLTRTLAKVQGELAVAKAEQDNVIGMARNEKNESIGIAERNHTEVIDNANGEAVAFLAKAAEYERAPEITRQWMYLNTMTIVLSGLDEKLVIEDGSGSGIAKHLPLKDFFSPAPQASSSGGAK
jgi:membrane protease subunit HflK